ncbi:hypothetical protein [Flavobacterium sp.]|uniref:hypothetical protein n=1 Tax=Flavobacterium sp. TaxID=239 RepID=UPI0025B84ABB|nr:hypothetical protein [Flavobacterium sp.]MBA4155049.1 hypothetical protein [Flavobacterium sp.]
MNVLIKKATIRGSLFLNFEFDQTDGDVKNNIKTACDAPIHDDLRLKFRELIPFFTYITEEITDEKVIEDAVKNPEEYVFDFENAKSQVFFKYRVYEFSIQEKKGFEMLTLSGSKQLANHQEISFSTPPIDMDSSDKYMTELRAVIERMKEEVVAYMQGKQAPKTQLEMFGSSTDDSGAFEE